MHIFYTLLPTDGLDKLGDNVYATRLLIAHAKDLRNKSLKQLAPIFASLLAQPNDGRMDKAVAISSKGEARLKMPEEFRDRLGVFLPFFLSLSFSHRSQSLETASRKELLSSAGNGKYMACGSSNR
jgi:hypothetical protein